MKDENGSLKIIFWKKLDLLLAITLLVLSAVTYWLSLYTNTLFSSWLINVSAGLLSSLFIIFGIDALRFRRFETKKRTGKSVAHKDLQRLANMCISYSLFAIGVLSYDSDLLSKDIGDNWSATTNRLILNKALQSNFTDHVSRITPQILGGLKLNFSLMAAELRDSIIFYGELIPFEVHGELLNVRQAFNQLLTSFALWEPFLFRVGENHNTQYKLIGDAFLTYTLRVDDFTRALGEWI